MKLKKGDAVIIIAGKNRGKQGKIERVFPKENKIVVIGVNIAKHHLKPSRKNPHGGIIEKSAPISSSNALIVCPHCSQPTRIGFKMIAVIGEKTAGGKKMRICKKCQESVEQNV